MWRCSRNTPRTHSVFCSRRRMLPCLFSLFLLPFVHSSGYLELQLKAAFPLNVTVEMTEGVWFPTNKRVYHMPLQPEQTRILTGIPVQFGHPAIILINSGPVEKFGLAYATIRSERWNTERMNIASAKIQLPFTGLFIDIRCDRNWFGPQCDYFCDEEKARIAGKRCTNLGKLGCPQGLRGWNCDRFASNDLPECGCLNGGVCSQVYRSGMICECEVGYEGPKCENKKYKYATALKMQLYGTDHKWKLLNHFFNSSLVDNELAHVFV